MAEKLTATTYKFLIFGKEIKELLPGDSIGLDFRPVQINKFDKTGDWILHPRKVVRNDTEAEGPPVVAYSVDGTRQKVAPGSVISGRDASGRRVKVRFH